MAKRPKPTGLPERKRPVKVCVARRKWRSACGCVYTRGKAYAWRTGPGQGREFWRVWPDYDGERAVSAVMSKATFARQFKTGDT